MFTKKNSVFCNLKACPWSRRSRILFWRKFLFKRLTLILYKNYWKWGRIRREIVLYYSKNVLAFLDNSPRSLWNVLQLVGSSHRLIMILMTYVCQPETCVLAVYYLFPGCEDCQIRVWVSNGKSVCVGVGKLSRVKSKLRSTSY